MPSNYTHFRFAGEVLKKSDTQIAQMIRRDIPLYLIGAHGPDILFYYKAWKTNEVNGIGYAMHRDIARPFFENAVNLIETSCCSSSAFAYIAGFITHFALDSRCHGYVNLMEAEGVSHTETEMQFDRYLMVKDGLDPLRYDSTSHIEANMRNAGIIAPFFQLDSLKVRDALRYMKKINRFFIAPQKSKRRFIYGILKLAGKYEQLSGMVMSYRPDEQCAESCVRLEQLFDGSVDFAVELIRKFADGDVGAEFDRNYDD